jgi:hypothetical protein
MYSKSKKDVMTTLALFFLFINPHFEYVPALWVCFFEHLKFNYVFFF